MNGSVESAVSDTVTSPSSLGSISSVDSACFASLQSVDSTSSSSIQSAESSPVVSSTTKPVSVTSYLPPCRLCGATASGFHYGANTCEACKAFFRRCTGKDFQPKPCPNNGECTEVIRGRLVCVACRFKKCIEVGMTKTASKKGRYTHERRTQYTNEIKGEELKRIKLEASKPPELSETERIVYEQTLEEINRQSEESFPEMNAYMHEKVELDLRIDKLIAEHCPNDSMLNHPIYSPGSGDLQIFKAFNDNFTYAAEQMKSSTDPSQASLAPNTLNTLWQNWMMVAEVIFVQLTRFAKQLPGFGDLHIDDRIVLLKAARIEVSTLMAHPACRPDKQLIGMYSNVSGELILTPLMIFPPGEDTDKFNDQHNAVMARLIKNQYTLEELNVIIAFILVSPDREGLVEPKKVEQLQDNMLKVLEFSLRRNHPDAVNRLPETLLILPELRELSEKMRQLLYTGKEELNPDLTPLINEVL